VDFASQNQMAVMNRIECSAVDADFHFQRAECTEPTLTGRFASASASGRGLR
jgi:hypothetical protein